MKINYALMADVAEYAAMHGISFEAAQGVLVLTGWDGLRAIITRKAAA
ncbi:MAG: hypothetical protein Q7U78_05985 [Gallionella sp.]|nr:hypothetical protein [Gallionella sp.]